MPSIPLTEALCVACRRTAAVHPVITHEMPPGASMAKYSHYITKLLFFFVPQFF
jgi:hypothetical protein